MIKILASFWLFFLNFIKGQLILLEFKSSAYSSIPLLILNHFTNIQVPENKAAIFHFALSILIFATALFGAIFNLFLTICVLYYKNKYDLESKFSNYPLLVRIIKFYEKASYVSIVYSVVWTLLFLSFIIFISVMILLSSIE